MEEEYSFNSFAQIGIQIPRAVKSSLEQTVTPHGPVDYLKKVCNGQHTAKAAQGKTNEVKPQYEEQIINNYQIKHGTCVVQCMKGTKTHRQQAHRFSSQSRLSERLLGTTSQPASQPTTVATTRMRDLGKLPQHKLTAVSRTHLLLRSTAQGQQLVATTRELKSEPELNTWHRSHQQTRSHQDRSDYTSQLTTMLITSKAQGCKPIGLAVASPCTSNQPSPRTSVNPSPVLSSFASPVSNQCNYYVSNTTDPNSLIPWLKNLSSGSCPAPSKFPLHLYRPGGSISAPVTPPISSPTPGTPRMKDDPTSCSFWPGLHYPFLPYSTTQSPGTQTPPDSGWLSGGQTPQDGPSSPTFSLVSPNHFTFKEPLSNGGSRMWTPGQSGTCSPIVAPGIDRTADVPMSDAISAEFAFGCNNTIGVVKAWEGERIHDECVPDDLELTLGNSGTR
ncbi:hypothetical protein F511_33342 [Dorcoceras hygrometricum]|uniref:Protein BZR1 homolog n=1 Tax=Dorcoceras hygrometricum TaxID=472368 RepID=A0A2Z7CK85_9LAMI|nr:hypothetical protein F511_33342 [Dorcoceras hygrometricum]